MCSTRGSVAPGSMQVGTFDPESAAEAGLRLEQLVWINCEGQAESALKAADLLLHGGGFGWIVLDLADVAEASVRRISMASRRRRGARGSSRPASATRGQLLGITSAIAVA